MQSSTTITLYSAKWIVTIDTEMKKIMLQL